MADTQTEPDAGPEGFFRLPLELRYDIYEMVYGEKRVVKLMSRHQFRKLESDRRKQELRRYVPRTFPGGMFNHLVVNTQFLDEAARVWVRTKTFAIHECRTVSEGLETTSAAELHLLRPITTIVFQANTSRVRSDTLSVFPKLTSLVLPLSYHDFERPNSSKTPFEDDFTDAEIAAFSDMQELLQFREMIGVEIAWQPCSFQERDKLPKWCHFKSQVQALLRDVTSQPRERIGQTKENPTFREALDAGPRVAEDVVNSDIAASLSPETETLALTDDEVPEDPDDQLRTFLLKPQGMSKWIAEAKAAKAKLDEILSI